MSSINTVIKRSQDIMRGDDLSGTVQYLKQIIWLLFLKVYDAKEREWEILDNNYISIIPDELKWRNWAEDKNDGKALTGQNLILFVNNELIPKLKNLEINEFSPKKHLIVHNIFMDASNLMKDGTKLRQMINTLNEIDFTDNNETHEFGDLYESMLKDLQESKRDGGEFYTPRALTDFITEIIDPSIGDTIADFACGTGGFLISAIKYLGTKVSNIEDQKMFNKNIYGIEKKSFPYSLALTNLILHDVDDPQIINGNSLNKDVRNYRLDEKFDVILMNPPYGGIEDDIIKMNFPSNLRCSETANLFMILIMYRLNLHGRAGVILPDGFFFAKEGSAKNIKEELFSKFNVHTIIRLPASVFAPYTSITTNVIFFDNNQEGTKETWFYRMDMPEGYKAFSKTKPIQLKHFEVVREWLNDRKELIDSNGFEKAKKYSFDEIKKRDFDIDLCGFQKKSEEIGDPYEIIEEYLIQKEENDRRIKEILKQIKEIMENDN